MVPHAAGGVPLLPGGLSESETALVEALVAEKYATQAWTRRGETAVAGSVPARGHAAG